jgi:putative DNA primase/helicase
MDRFEIHAIAKNLGGDVTGRDTANVPGPGHSPADRSLSIKLNLRAPGGFVVYSHAGDNPIECRNYVCAKLGLLTRQRGEHRREPLIVTDGGNIDEARRKALALKLWMEATNPAGSIVERYLGQYRGLDLPADVARNTIRFHPALYFDRQKNLPAMVCLLRNVTTNEPCGIHRTFLDQNTGDKIERKMLGIAKGAAVKFDLITTNAPLTIGEGIETALSAREAGFGKTWAVGSSGAVRTLPLVDVPELTLLQENDATSRRDTAACAKRYLAAGKPVTIVRAKVGNDLNDVWRLGGEIGR